MAEMLLGGLDIGTTGCKLSVFDGTGNFIMNSYRTYDVSRSCGNSEIDAETIFSAVCEVFREVTGSHTLAAVGVSSFGETFAALDENDRALFPSMLYTDPRGEEEIRELCAKLGEEMITDVAGVKPHSMYSLAKAMWLKKHHPDTFAKVRHLLLMEDFIIYKLTGVRQIDYSLAARTMALDIRKKCWSKELFDAAGIDPDLFAKPVPTGSVAGKLKPELAETWHTAAFTVVNGSHDQVASAIGAGVLEPGQAVDGTGTVECVVPVFRGIPSGKRIYEEGYSVVPFLDGGNYVCYALSFTGGATVKWFRDELARDLRNEKNAYAILDGSIPEQPTGILILPHFAGAANPYMDVGSKAAIIGLTLEHRREDLYRAMLEGVTYEIMTNISHLEEDGVPMKSLYATGGGANSPVWLQIKADVLNRPITALQAKEVGACGTVMLCAVALGLCKNLKEAKRIFVKEGKTYFPNRQNAAKYASLYATYRKLYDAVRPLTENLS